MPGSEATIPSAAAEIGLSQSWAVIHIVNGMRADSHKITEHTTQEYLNADKQRRMRCDPGWSWHPRRAKLKGITLLRSSTLPFLSAPSCPSLQVPRALPGYSTSIFGGFYSVAFGILQKVLRIKLWVRYSFGPWGIPSPDGYYNVIQKPLVVPGLWVWISLSYIPTNFSVLALINIALRLFSCYEWISVQRIQLSLGIYSFLICLLGNKEIWEGVGK